MKNINQHPLYITRNISIENEAQSDTLRGNEALLSENSYSVNKEISESVFSTNIYRNRNTVTIRQNPHKSELKKSPRMGKNLKNYELIKKSKKNMSKHRK